MYDDEPKKHVEIEWSFYCKNNDAIEDILIEDILGQLNFFATQPELILSECDFLLNHFHAKKSTPKNEHILLVLQKIHASMLQIAQTQSNRSFLDALIYNEKGIYTLLQNYNLIEQEKYKVVLDAIENCYHSRLQILVLSSVPINEYLSADESIKSIRYHHGQMAKVPSSTNLCISKLSNLRALAEASETLFCKILQQHYQGILSGLESKLTRAKTKEDVQEISDQLEQCIPVWIEQQQYTFARKLLSALYKYNLIATRELGLLLRVQLLFLRYQLNQHAAKHHFILKNAADAELALTSLFYPWQHQRAALHQLRINLPCYFQPKCPRENLAAVLEQHEDDIEGAKINSVEKTEKKLSQALIDFTAKLFKRCQQFLGEPPEAFALFALGSLSLNAATPYSDLEYGIVRASDNLAYSAYFNDLLELFHLSVELIGEVSLTDSNDRREGYQSAGYHVDSNMHPLTTLQGKNKGNARLQGSVISIIATLTSLPATEDDVIEPSDKISNALQHTVLLYATQPLNCNEHGQVVFKELRKALAAKSQEAYSPQNWQEKLSFGQLTGIGWHSVRALTHLNDMVVNTVGVMGLKPLSQKISIKEHLYALLKYWVMDLANYYNFTYSSVHEALSKLEKNNKLDKVFAAELKKALTILTVIRYRAQLFYHHQKEDEYVVFADQTKVDNEHYILNTEEAEYLRWIYQCVITPCYLLLKKWGLEENGIKKQGKDILQKFDHCSKLDPAVDLMKQNCETYQIELYPALQYDSDVEEWQIIESYIEAFVDRFNLLHNITIIKSMLKKDLRFYTYTLEKGRNIFQLVCERSSYKIVDKLLDFLQSEGMLDTMIQAKKPLGWNPIRLNEKLMVTIKKGNADEVETLLNLGADIQTKSSTNKTLIQIAAEANQWEIIKILMKKGLTCFADEGHPRPLIHIAVENKDEVLIDLILQSGISLDVKNANGLSALHKAVIAKDTGRIKYLLEKGANPNFPTPQGNTSLHLAFHHNLPDEIVLLLIQNRAYYKERNQEGKRPIDMVSNIKLLYAMERTHKNAKQRELQKLFTRIHFLEEKLKNYEKKVKVPIGKTEDSFEEKQPIISNSSFNVK